MYSKCLIIFFAFLEIVACGSEEPCVLTQEDKQWLNETYSEKQFWMGWVDLNPDPLKVFNRLEEKCILEPQDKVRSLKIAMKWLTNAQHCKTVFSWQSFNYSDVEELINNKNIDFTDQGEKDLLFFTLCDFVHNTENQKNIDCLFVPALSLENHNKLLYRFHPVFNSSNFWTIQNCIKNFVNNNLPITEEESIKTFFNPVMYAVFDDRVRRYEYKEVISISAIPVMVTCFHILRKNRQLIIPKVLVSHIAEHIIERSLNNWTAIKQDLGKFTHYCDYIERTIPFLMEQDITAYNLKPAYFTEQRFSDPKQFKQLYAALKK